MAITTSALSTVAFPEATACQGDSAHTRKTNTFVKPGAAPQSLQ